MLQNVFTVAISSDFFSAFAALPRTQQAKVSRFVEKFRENPSGPGINYERIEQARDKNLRSVRIDEAYRGIVLRPEKGNVYVLLWVDHHDEAYRWAANKMCPVNPESGSLQVVDVTVAAASTLATDRPAAPGLFAALRERNLLRLGVPELYLPRVLAVADDAGLECGPARRRRRKIRVGMGRPPNIRPRPTPRRSRDGIARSEAARRSVTAAKHRAADPRRDGSRVQCTAPREVRRTRAPSASAA